MDVLALLTTAHEAGLTVRADGENLVVTGPKVAEPIARRLAACKPQVLETLRAAVAPCRRCGCPSGWRTCDDHVACWSCESPPTGAVRLLLVSTPAGPAWEREDRQDVSGTAPAKTELTDADISTWEECQPWDDSTPSCPKCKSVAGWTDALDQWHCWACCPPHRTVKVLYDRERVLREAWRRTRRRHGGRER